MATKLGRKVIHHDRLLPINFHDPPITWSCEITWKTKTIISPLSQWLRPRNLVGWWLILKGSNSHNVLITWSCKVTWQTKIIRSLLPISSTYGHQQGSGLHPQVTQVCEVALTAVTLGQKLVTRDRNNQVSKTRINGNFSPTFTFKFWHAFIYYSKINFENQQT